MPTYREAEDPFGCILLDYLHGRALSGDFSLENEQGGKTPAMPPEWYFNKPERWYEWERETLSTISGPVLDLGCGAGRASLFVQGLGLDVTAVDASPGAVAVCKARGINDVRLGDLREPPNDKEWGAILMLCGNLGLAGGWNESQQLLRMLAELSRTDAVLIADTVDPTVGETESSPVRAYQRAQLQRGKYEGLVGLRLHYGEMTSPWWEQSNILINDVPRLVDGTGWKISDHHIDGVDHYIAMSKEN